MITRCECCQGKKTIIGLGGLIKDCPKCGGVGHVKDDEPVIDKPKRTYIRKEKKVDDEREETGRTADSL